MGNWRALAFGDVFRFQEREFVFLAQTLEIIYAAEILDQVKSRLLVKTYEQSVSKSKDISQITYFCFVILETGEFKDRVATMHKPGHDPFYVSSNILTSLNEKDKNALRLEILKPKSAAPGELKHLVSQIPM